MPTKWPIFICYRQSDGTTAAERIYEILHNQRLPIRDVSSVDDEPPELDVYFDQAAPGVGDWKSVHEPYLKRSRALIVVCTPGSKINEGEKDWVHKEINWWLSNRDIAPILVDPLDQGERYIPDAILNRWPNAQRISLTENEWQKTIREYTSGARERIRAQIIGGVVQSGADLYRQELQLEQNRVAKLNFALENQRRLSRRLFWALMGMLAALALMIGAVCFAYQQMRAAQNAQSSAENALKSEREARAETQSAEFRQQLLQAQRHLERKEYNNAFHLAVALRDSPEIRSTRDGEAIDAVIVSAVNNLAIAKICTGFEGKIKDLQFSPDGSQLLATSSQNRVFIWNVTKCKEPIVVQQHEDVVSTAAWSENGASFASAAWDQRILLQTGESQNVIHVAPEFGRIVEMTFSTPSELVVLTSKGVVVSYLVSSIDAPIATKLHFEDDFLPRRLKGHFAFLAKDNIAKILDLRLMKPIVQTKFDTQLIDFFWPIEEGARFIVGLDDKSVWIIPSDGQTPRRLGAHEESIEGASFALNTMRLLTYSKKETFIWDLAGMYEQKRFTPHSKAIVQASLVSSSLALSASAETDELMLWRTGDGETVFKIQFNRLSELGYALSSDAKNLAISLDKNIISIRPVLGDFLAAKKYYCNNILLAENNENIKLSPSFCSSEPKDKNSK